MFEKYFAAIPAQLFTADGTTLGLVTIADTSLFKIRQVLYAASTSQPNLELEIKKIISSTQLVVGPLARNIFTTTDISAYLVTDTANVFANEQVRPLVGSDEYERAVYEEEPIVAKRVLLVDESGNRIDASNPLPTTATVTVGNITIGTADQGLPNTVAHAWPMKISDGTNTAGVTLSGKLKVTVDSTSTNTISLVNASASNVTLLTANPNRVGGTVYNDSTSILYVKLGTSASSTSYTIKMGPNTFFEFPFHWTGQVDAVWVIANGFALVGELS